MNYKSFALSFSLAAASNLALAATATIDSNYTLITSNEMTGATSKSRQVSLSGKPFNAEVLWAISPAFDGSVNPCRQSKTDSRLVSFGLHSENTRLSFNSNFSKWVKENGTEVAFGDNLPIQRWWASPMNQSVAARDMAHWMGGCFHSSVNDKIYLPAHSENYVHYPTSTANVLDADTRTWRTANVPSVVKIDKNSITYGASSYPNSITAYSSWFGANGKNTQKLMYIDYIAPPNASGTQNQYEQPFDLSLFAAPYGLAANPSGATASQRLSKVTTIIKAPPMTAIPMRSLTSPWKSSTGQTLIVPGESYPTSPMRDSGQWELSNLLTVKSSTGKEYVMMFTGHHPVEWKGFPNNAFGNHYNADYVHPTTGATNATIPTATYLDNPYTKSVKIDPDTMSYGPVLVRAIKANMENPLAWQVFGYGTGNTTKPGWVSICAGCTVDSSLPISSSNIRPYVFFKNLQPNASNCVTPNVLSSCQKYHPYVNSPMGQSLRIINGKVVQFGSQTNGKLYMSYFSNIANPLEMETNYTLFSLHNGDEIPKVPGQSGYLGTTTHAEDFRMPTAHYLSVFDPKDTSLNLESFVKNADGSYTGYIVVAYRGTGGLTKGTPLQPRLVRYGIRITGL